MNHPERPPPARHKLRLTLWIVIATLVGVLSLRYLVFPPVSWPSLDEIEGISVSCRLPVDDADVAPSSSGPFREVTFDVPREHWHGFFDSLSPNWKDHWPAKWKIGGNATITMTDGRKIGVTLFGIGFRVSTNDSDAAYYRSWSFEKYVRGMQDLAKAAGVR